MEENVNNMQDRVRYSDEELEEFKELILEKLARARKDLEMLNDNVSGDDNSANDTAPTFKILEEGSNVLSKEENSQLASRQYKYIQNLENALIRIENKNGFFHSVLHIGLPEEAVRQAVGAVPLMSRATWKTPILNCL